MENVFKIVQTHKPAASKKQSQEIYLIGQNYMSDFLRTVFIWVALGTLIFFVFNNIENASPREEISYSQFKQEVLSDRVAEVTYKGDQMTIHGQRLDGTRFETRHPMYKRDEAVDCPIKGQERW